MICSVGPDESGPPRPGEPPAQALIPPALPRLPVESPGTPPPAAAPCDAPLLRPAESPPGEACLRLTRADQLFVGALAAVAVALMLAHWVRLSGWGVRPVEIDRLQPQEYQYQIDVNRAGWVELALLEGIGEALARRIVEERELHGPFTHVEDLRRVKGVGPKTLERIRQQVRVTALGEEP